MPAAWQILPAALESLLAMVVAVVLALTFSGLEPSSVLVVLFRASLWNFVWWRHAPNISDLELMSLVLSCLQQSRMQHLSFMHREQEFVPKPFMQLMIFPCERISTRRISRTWFGLIFSPCLKCLAK